MKDVKEQKQNDNGEIIEMKQGQVIKIPKNGGKAWLTLFYSLPQEFVSKRPVYLNLPRCPYEVLRTDKYDSLIKDDTFLELVWDCVAWSAWQYFEIPYQNGSGYREIPGSPAQYSGDFPLWRLSYSMLPLLRDKFEVSGFSFQQLYNVPEGTELPWLTYQQFGNLIGTLVPEIIQEQNWQPMIDEIWNNRTLEDFDKRGSQVKLEEKGIDSFEALETFAVQQEASKKEAEEICNRDGREIRRLKELSEAYAAYAPYIPIRNEYLQKKGIAQAVYHSQHKKELETAKELRIPVYELLREGEKFTPKKWEAQIKELTQEYEKQSRRYGRSTVNLAYVELLRHNRKMDERDQKNKDQSQSRQHEKMDRGQKQKKKHQEMEL